METIVVNDYLIRLDKIDAIGCFRVIGNYPYSSYVYDCIVNGHTITSKKSDGKQDVLDRLKEHTEKWKKYLNGGMNE